MAVAFGLSFFKKKSLDASLVSFDWDGYPLTIAYPETFMNLSGRPVAKLLHQLRLDPQRDLLILVDDVALPFGRLRLRGFGSDGGHNGLKSIHQALNSAYYARLRIGIGAVWDEGKRETSLETLERYVLSPFPKEEERAFAKIQPKALEAARWWLSEPIDKAMSIVNDSKFMS